MSRQDLRTAMQGLCEAAALAELALDRNGEIDNQTFEESVERIRSAVDSCGATVLSDGGPWARAQVFFEGARVWVQANHSLGADWKALFGQPLEEQQDEYVAITAIDFDELDFERQTRTLLSWMDTMRQMCRGKFCFADALRKILAVTKGWITVLRIVDEFPADQATNETISLRHPWLRLLHHWLTQICAQRKKSQSELLSNVNRAALRAHVRNLRV
ncbi:MAG: hypothetical protein AAF495_14200 [Pseudomonadota bacterium]